MTSRFFVFTMLLTAMGCGGFGLDVRRYKDAPAKPSNCDIAIVSRHETSDFEEVGYIALSSRANPYPMDEKNTALAKPEACKLGGDAMVPENSSTGGVGYVVLKRRAQ